MSTFLAIVLLACLVASLWLGRSKKRANRLSRSSPPEVRSQRAIPPATASRLPPGEPITTQSAAKAALRAVLEARGYGRNDKSLLRETLSDLSMEMKEHAEELRSDVEFLAEEITKQVEYRSEIADQLNDAREDSPESGAQAPELEKTRRHLEHLDREIAQMRANQDRHRAALKAFRADKTAFVVAYADYVLGCGANPNHSRSKFE